MDALPASELHLSAKDKTKEELVNEIADLQQQIARLKVSENHYKETAKRLQASEERFRQVVLAVRDLVYVTEITKNGDYLNLYISPHVEALTGYPLETFLHNWSFWSSHVVHPEDRALTASQVAKLAKGQNIETEYRLIRADGEIIWVHDKAKTQRNPQTSSKIIYGVVNNITERRRLEDRLVAIYQLGQELHLLRDEKTILKRVLKTITKILQGESASYGLADEEVGELSHFQQLFPDSSAKIGLSLPLNNDGDIAAVVVHNGQSFNTGPMTQNIQSKTTERRTRSLLSVPLRVGERVIGVLNIESFDTNRFTPSDRQLLQILADQTAISIENTRLYNETRQRVEELAAMSMIGQAIISTLDLHETLAIITDHAIRLLDVGAAVIALYDRNKGDLWCAAASGEGADLIRGQRLPLEQSIAGWVAQHGEPALIPDTAQDSRFLNGFNAFDQSNGLITRSVLSVPLQTGIQTIGAIELKNKKQRPFDQKDLRLLGWLAMPAATAIENARLYEAQRAAREQAETLREATSTLTSTLNLNHLLDNILIHLEQVIPYDNAYVFLRESVWLNVVAGRGARFLQKQPLEHLRRPVDDSLYQEIQNTGRPLIVTNAQEEPRLKNWENVNHIHSWMGAPLMVRSQVIGYLTLESQKLGAYDATEAKLAQAFANQAAVAIQNARLFEEVNIGHQRLQSLSRRLVQRQETERRRIARELHDEAGQALTTLRVGLHLLEQEAHNSEAIIEQTTKLKGLAENVLENLHRLAIDLRPASLDHLGLVAALDQFIETFGEQHHLIVQFETVNFTDQRLPPTVETSLYRIVQEALTNVIRHAKASRADVFLKRRGDQIIILIEDDGLGFEPQNTGHSSRLGLVGMRERAEMLGGNLIIESAIGNGTTVYVEVPYLCPSEC